MTEKLTTAEQSALHHWSLYGQPGEASKHRVTAGEWEVKPFVTPVTSPWDVPVSGEQLPKLLNGFRPQEMEDKWFVYADGPDVEGHAKMHFFRSWTGFKIAEVEIAIVMEEPAQQGKKSVEPCARIKEIMWESSESSIRGNTEEGAKEGVLEVLRWVLGVKLMAEDKE